MWKWLGEKLIIRPLNERTYICRHPKNSRLYYILEILFCTELGNDFE